MKKFFFAALLSTLWSGQALAVSCSSSTLTSCPSPNYNSPNAYSVNIGGSLAINSSGVFVGTGVNVGSGAVTGGAGSFTTLQSSGAFTPTGGIVGNATGAAPAAGYVGQLVSAISGSVSLPSTAFTTLSSVSLTPGEYSCNGYFSLGTLSAATTNAQVVLTTVANSNSGSIYPAYYAPVGSNVSSNAFFTTANAILFVTSTETIYVNGYVQGVTTTGSYGGIYCLRVR